MRHVSQASLPASQRKHLHARIACAPRGVIQKWNADTSGEDAIAKDEFATLSSRTGSLVIAHPLERVITVAGVVTAAGALFSLLFVGVSSVGSDGFLVLWVAIALALTPLTPLLDQKLRPLFWQPVQKEGMDLGAAPVMGAWTRSWLRCTYAALLLGLSPIAQLEASSVSTSPALQIDDQAGVDEAYLCACLSIQNSPWLDTVEGSTGGDYPVG